MCLPLGSCCELALQVCAELVSTHPSFSQQGQGHRQAPAAGAGKGKSEKWDVRGMQSATAVGAADQAQPGPSSQLGQSGC